jgi:hypothetical protein
LKRILNLTLVAVLLALAAVVVSSCSATPTTNPEVAAIRAYADPATQTTLQGLSEDNLAKYTQYADAQFLLFTHDELWVEILKRDLPTGKWVFKELTKWTKDDGLNIKESPATLKEHIRYNLDENDITGAANKCRTLIEERGGPH